MARIFLFGAVGLFGLVSFGGLNASEPVVGDKMSSVLSHLREQTSEQLKYPMGVAFDDTLTTYPPLSRPSVEELKLAFGFWTDGTRFAFRKQDTSLQPDTWSIGLGAIGNPHIQYFLQHPDDVQEVQGNPASTIHFGGRSEYEFDWKTISRGDRLDVWDLAWAPGLHPGLLSEEVFGLAKLRRIERTGEQTVYAGEMGFGKSELAEAGMGDAGGDDRMRYHIEIVVEGTPPMIVGSSSRFVADMSPGVAAPTIVGETVSQVESFEVDPSGQKIPKRVVFRENSQGVPTSSVERTYREFSLRRVDVERLEESYYRSKLSGPSQVTQYQTAEEYLQRRR